MSTRTILYFIAHPDDENVNMGSSIAVHKAAGHDVHVICVTEGGGTGVRTSGSFTTWLGRTPSREELAERRIAEFHEATRRLGIPFDRRHVVGLLDGQTTYSDVYCVIKEWLEKYPQASLKGHSWIDANIDHHNIGKAMLALRDEGRVVNNDVRWYINRRYIPEVPFPKGSTTRPPAGIDVADLTNGAAAVYKRAHKTYDWWGIGYRSAASLFNDSVGDTFSRNHRGPEEFRTPQDKAAAEAWVASKHACCA